jgi:hypothetical protein
MLRNVLCIVLTSALFLLPLSAAEKAPEKILFIGNSYTGNNQLPTIFKEVVASGGHAAPVIKSSNPGGKTLEQHLGVKSTLTLIEEGGWDVVIIQGQSQEAAMAQQYENMRKSFMDGGKALCEMIHRKSPQARIVWYQTWARHPDYWKAKTPDLAVGKLPEEMMVRNRASYDALAKSVPKSMVARVGEAWALYYKTHPGKDLHSGDNSHPTFAGSYLAALVIYQTIYQPPTMKIAYRGNLTETLAAELQKTAAANGKR